MNKKAKYKLTLLLLACIFMICSCSKNDDGVENKNAQIMAVNNTKYENTLYYSGNILPVGKQPVESPVEGTVIKTYFKYGDCVQLNQKLFSIKSEKSRTAFQTALNNYIKAKQTADDSKNKMDVSEKLYKLEIESKNNCDEAKNKYLNDQLAFVDAKNELAKILKSHGISEFPEIATQDFAAIKKVMETLKNKMETVEIYAPKSGIVLFPKDNASEEDAIFDGTQVKEAQNLVNIGDDNGFVVKIQIDETDINNIHVGEDASVSIEALPNVTFAGKVSNVTTQAILQNNQPYFLVSILVTKILPEQKHKIHFGMSAKVAVLMQNNPQILIPLQAVKHVNGKNYVDVVNSKNGKSNSVEVVTGETTQNSVVITSGIKAGDKIVVSN